MVGGDFQQKIIQELLAFPWNLARDGVFGSVDPRNCRHSPPRATPQRRGNAAGLTRGQPSEALLEGFLSDLPRRLDPWRLIGHDDPKGRITQSGDSAQMGTWGPQDSPNPMGFWSIFQIRSIKWCYIPMKSMLTMLKTMVQLVLKHSAAF